MKICVAQIKAVRGDLGANIENHKRFILKAGDYRANIIIFPELSLTGYEPTLAGELATMPNDSRLDDFQILSNNRDMMIGVGLPLKNHPRPMISMVIFRPSHPRQVYSKQYIHADEEPYFVNGRNAQISLPSPPNIALAICYEISVPEHAQSAHQNGAEIYLSSVAKFKNGIEKSFDRLSDIARIYSMTVLMSNCVGVADGLECAGGTAVWNNQGTLLGQLDNTNEGVLIFDSSTQEVTWDIL